MIFKEKLPYDCPPSGALDAECRSAFRLIRSEMPEDSDFASHAANGDIKPAHIDACAWSSCSFFISLDILKKKRDVFRKLQKYSYYAEMSIPAGAGRYHIKNGHIDFWMSATFAPLSAINNVGRV